MQNEATRCPLCQGRNGCALANGGTIEVCWCQQQVFMPKNSLNNPVLETKACICQACAQALLQEAKLGARRID